MVQTAADAQSAPCPIGQIQSATYLNGRSPIPPNGGPAPPDQTAAPAKRPTGRRAQTVPLTADQQEMVVANMPVALWEARRAGRHCGREEVRDLGQTAMVALCRAAQQWNPLHGALFGSYAAMACRRAIRDEINERLGVIALPRWLFRQEGVGHALWACVDQSKRVGVMGESSEPESAQVQSDDHLEAEAFLAWIDPSDRDLIVAYLGGETMRDIGRRLGCRRSTVARTVARILGELRVRAQVN